MKSNNKVDGPQASASSPKDSDKEFAGRKGSLKTVNGPGAKLEKKAVAKSIPSDDTVSKGGAKTFEARKVTKFKGKNGL